ncbi:MAG: response regulator [Elusimicrobiota bacterium]|nr:response regulator [Elusimicrobiota bacterium]
MNKKLNILQVEDSEEDASLVRNELQRGGIEVVHERVDTAEDVKAALGRRTWDIILSDYRMPQFSALDALKIVREVNPDIPFVIISGTVGEDIAVEALNRGASDYLMKGNLKRLVPAIERELREAAERRARRQADESLRESEEIFRHFLKYSPIYVFFKDENIKAIRLSDNYATMLGKPISELLGKNMDDIFPSDLAKSMVADDKRVLKEGKEVKIEEELNGRFYSTIKFPVYREGQATYLAGFTIDITERKRAEEKQAKTEEQLRQSQKMEAMGLLAGGVAHDFNNILTAIKCYAEFLRNDLAPGDLKRQDAQEIVDAAERAASLTRQLLAFSRHQIMVPRLADVNGIVGNLTNMLRRIIGEDVALETRLFPEPCPALVDAGQIEQVILNLAVNARDAMPGGGTLILETEIMRPPQEFFTARPELPAGPLVCLKVRDTGTGITGEVKSRIFEPFFTTKEQGKGTGLGLPMVFGIVKQSRGEIEVESEPGKGTAFLIYLPLAEACLISIDPAKEAKAAAKGQETVLFVEDEESLRRLGERILRGGGYTVLVAADGQAALKLMEERGKPADLLLTDVVMPGMSGRELATELARRKLVGRTLYMSGYIDDAIVKHGVLKPGIAFIYKPFTVGAVLLKLREVLDGPADKAKA